MPGKLIRQSSPFLSFVLIFRWGRGIELLTFRFVTTIFISRFWHLQWSDSWLFAVVKLLKCRQFLYVSRFWLEFPSLSSVFIESIVAFCMSQPQRFGYYLKSVRSDGLYCDLAWTMVRAEMAKKTLFALLATAREIIFEVVGLSTGGDYDRRLLTQSISVLVPLLPRFMEVYTEQTISRYFPILISTLLLDILCYEPPKKWWDLIEASWVDSHTHVIRERWVTSWFSSRSVTGVGWVKLVMLRRSMRK